MLAAVLLPFLAALAAPLVTRRFGSRSGWFLALAPVHVHYSRELNQYAAVGFVTVAALLSWERLLQRSEPADWWRYGAVSVVALGLHYGLAFPLLAMG